jgi:tight adherence protein C
VLDSAAIIIPILSFVAVAGIVFVLGHYYSTQIQMQQRLPDRGLAPDVATASPLLGLHAFVSRNFDAKRFGYNPARLEKLRIELLKSGYFSRHAPSYYIFARLLCATAFPLSIYAMTQFFSTNVPVFAKVLSVAIAALVGIAGPNAYLSRRQRTLTGHYRLAFPDLLDLQMVCVDAGMTIEGSFSRVQNEIAKRCRELGKNVELMIVETRAGRSTIEGLDSFADRLNLDEARSFATMVRQSIALGSDIAEALRVFSDEMREKRLMRAEEAANKLSVKMVIPLGLFIFPVILLVIMLPVVIKLLTVLR